MKKLFFNADVITMNPYRTMAEAVLVENGIILAVGKKEELLAQLSIVEQEEMEYIDVQGKAVLPGFVDGHSHMTVTMYNLMMANANPFPKGNCNSIEELVSELKRQYEEQKQTLKEGDWFMAMGYDESAYPDHQPPTKYDMDKVTTQYPVCCIHASGHNAVLNSKALEICGITDDYEVPAGGAMPRLPKTNEYSGMLQEAAFIQIGSKMKTPGVESMLKALEKCVKLYASYGITTAQEAKAGEKDLTILKMAEEKGMLKQDVVCYLDMPYCEKNLPKQYPTKNKYEGHIRYAGCKLFLDGSPQAKTAWLTTPYYEPPKGKPGDYCGFSAMTDEEVIQHMETCLKNHWQLNVHTNGDAAIDQFLRCYEAAQRKYPDRRNLRPVFIHCQTVRQDQLDQIKELGMLISFFEDHVYYWGDYHYESVLGPDRAEQISPLASALDREINCTLHQDTPVVNPNVMFSVHHAVNRVTKKGRILGAEQKVSVYEALRAVTLGGAYQIFEEDKKGSLEAGKYADMVVLDKNPMKVAAESIKDIKVLATIKKGEVIYQYHREKEIL